MAIALSHRFSKRVSEHLLSHRRVVLVAFSLITIVLAVSAARLRLDAGFEKSLPLQHPYLETFMDYRKDFGGANRVMVALRQRRGDIFNAAFLEQLRHVSDELFYIKGIERGSVKSITTSNARYIEVVDGGFSGGTIVPSGFTPTKDHFRTLRENIIKSGQLGRLVSHDFRSAVVSARLTELDPDSGETLDYREVARQLEEEIREKYSTKTTSIHILGFATLIGEITNQAQSVALLVGLTIAILIALLYLFTRSWQLTAFTLLSALTAIIWQLGLFVSLGFGIDPMSIVVVFLVFAIAISHGVQMVNAVTLQLRQGSTPLEAAKLSLAKLLVPGSTALASDIIGFLTILLVKIEMVRQTAIIASLGVGAALIINLFLLPVLLSCARPKGCSYPNQDELHPRGHRLWLRLLDNVWSFLATLARKRRAAGTLILCGGALVWGAWLATFLEIGDVGKGVSALHDDSRYNRDSAVVRKYFRTSLDILTVIAEGPKESCVDYRTVSAIDDLADRLSHDPGVTNVITLPRLAKRVFAMWNEGNPKWHLLPRDPMQLRLAMGAFGTDTGLLNFECSAIPIYVFTTDHRAQTIRRLVDKVDNFGKRDRLATKGKKRVRFRLASGNLGIAAAKNDVITSAQAPMLIYLYSCIVLLCLAFFRSWRAGVCIIAPLAWISVFTYALMASAGLGLTVTTLPVVALGAGIGVDYAIYLYSSLQKHFAIEGSLENAYRRTLKETGRAVVFTGATLGIGVGIWILSGLRFQSDMGKLLTFIFVGNMFAAIILVPALASFFFPAPRASSTRKSEGAPP